jgi:hypothetical protein
MESRKAADDQDGAAGRVGRAVHAHGALNREQMEPVVVVVVVIEVDRASSQKPAQ